MARDGNGQYSLPPGNPVAAGTKIEAAWANVTLGDVRDALTASLAKDGQTVPTADLPMGGYRHTNCSKGTARTHYATLGNLQDDATRYLGVVTSSNGNDLIGATTPTFSQFYDGQVITFRKDAKANTAVVTLAVNGMAAVSVLSQKGGGLSAGDLPANCVCMVQYIGGTFYLINAPSGLTSTNVVNADTLDSLDSTAFARRDITTSFAQDVTVVGTFTAGTAYVANVPQTANAVVHKGYVDAMLDARIGTINGVPILMHTNTAPTGWVRTRTDLNDKFIRMNNSSNMTGGGVTAVSAWATIHNEGEAHSTGSHVLVVGEIPSHTHDGTGLLGNVVGSGGAYRAPSGSNSASFATGSAGGDGGHSHSTDFRVAWVDMTLCYKA